MTDTVSPELRVDPVALARSLGGLVRASAEAGEADGTMAPAVVEALNDGGLFTLLVPTEFNGTGADVLTFVEVTEELSRADASVGWSYMVNASSAAMFAGAFDTAALEQIFGGATPAVTSFTGAIVPPFPTARRVEGGYVVTGKYSFGSGSGHATWIGAVCPIEGEEMPRLFAVPAEQVEILGNWDVLGLRGTGSADYQVVDQFVPDEFMATLGLPPRRGQASLRIGTVAMGVAGHTAVALGTARRALEELTAIADAGKQRFGSPPIIEQQLFRYEFAQMEARFRSCRAYVVECLTAALETATAGGPATDAEVARIRQSGTFAIQECREVVLACYTWGGSAGLRNPHPLGRSMRDMLGETQHALVDKSSLVDAAPFLFPDYR